MTQHKLTWIGLQVEDYVIDELISDGPFSSVYKGTHVDGAPDKAFKLAKPVVTNSQNRSINLTHAIAIYEGGIADVSPDSRELLLLHVNKMQTLSHPALIPIESIVDQPGLCYLKMEYIKGQTLRQLMNSGPVPVNVFINIARSLHELKTNAGLEYHGDLRPDNILVIGNEIKLLDSGYFGLLNCHEGPELECAVTNCHYYPTLEADDLLAFGIMLWEAACRHHPLIESSRQSEDGQHAGPSLLKWIGLYESIGQYFLSPWRNIKRPCNIRPGIPEQVETIALKSIGLSVNSQGLLDRGQIYTTFGELAGTLDDLNRFNIRSI